MTSDWSEIGHASDQADYLTEPDAAAKFHREVDREAFRLRVRDSAQQKVAAEKAVAEPPFDTGTLTEVLARPAEPPHWVEGLIRPSHRH
jgi:hypothetical protein